MSSMSYDVIEDGLWAIVRVMATPVRLMAALDFCKADWVAATETERQAMISDALREGEQETLRRDDWGIFHVMDRFEWQRAPIVA